MNPKRQCRGHPGKKVANDKAGAAIGNIYDVAWLRGAAVSSSRSAPRKRTLYVSSGVFCGIRAPAAIEKADFQHTFLEKCLNDMAMTGGVGPIEDASSRCLRAGKARHGLCNATSILLAIKTAGELTNFLPSSAPELQGTRPRIAR